MISAIAKVSSTDIMVIVSAARRAIRTRCIPYPTAKNSGTVMTSDEQRVEALRSWKYQARYAARNRNAECAIMTTRMTPKYSVSPDERRA